MQEREQCETKREDHEHEDAEPGVGQVVHRTAWIGGLAPVAEDELEREDGEGDVEHAPGDETDEARGSCPLVRCWAWSSCG